MPLVAHTPQSSHFGELLRYLPMLFPAPLTVAAIYRVLPRAKPLPTVAGFVLLAAMLCVLQRSFDTKQLDGFLARLERASHADTEKALEEALGHASDGEQSGLIKFRNEFLSFLKQNDRPNPPGLR